MIQMKLSVIMKQLHNKQERFYQTSKNLGFGTTYLLDAVMLERLLQIISLTLIITKPLVVQILLLNLLLMVQRLVMLDGQAIPVLLALILLAMDSLPSRKYKITANQMMHVSVIHTNLMVGNVLKRLEIKEILHGHLIVFGSREQ